MQEKEEGGTEVAEPHGGGRLEGKGREEGEGLERKGREDGLESTGYGRGGRSRRASRYRGTSFIRNQASLGPYRRTMPRALR